MVFKTKYRAYKSVVMNFSMTNTPSTFFPLMNSIFKPLLRKYVIMYLVDMIIFSKTEKQNKGDFKAVFNILKIN